jgi:hypothetical protein
MSAIQRMQPTPIGWQVRRPEDKGGNRTYSTADELEADYKSGALHPGETDRAAGCRQAGRLVESLLLVSLCCLVTLVLLHAPSAVSRSHN